MLHSRDHIIRFIYSALFLVIFCSTQVGIIFHMHSHDEEHHTVVKVDTSKTVVSDFCDDHCTLCDQIKALENKNYTTSQSFFTPQGSLIAKLKPIINSLHLSPLRDSYLRGPPIS